MSDKASVFETMSTQILSLTLQFVTPRRRSLSWNWVCMREPRGPICEFSLCAVPRSTLKGAKMVDEVDVHSISLVLLEFLSLRPVSLL